MKIYLTVLLSACFLLVSCSTHKEPLTISRVVLKTDFGDIELELDVTRPHFGGELSALVDAGLYNGGVFHRTVTIANQPTTP